MFGVRRKGRCAVNRVTILSVRSNGKSNQKQNTQRYRHLRAERCRIFTISEQEIRLNKRCTIYVCLFIMRYWWKIDVQ